VAELKPNSAQEGSAQGSLRDGRRPGRYRRIAEVDDAALNVGKGSEGAIWEPVLRFFIFPSTQRVLMCRKARRDARVSSAHGGTSGVLRVLPPEMD